MKRLIIMGDSLSATAESLPTFLTGYHLNLLAQGGRKVHEYQPPRDLRKMAPDDHVVYFLGTGDILTNADAADTLPYILHHLRQITAQGFNVTLVVPPKFKIKQFKETNRDHRRMMRAIDLPGVDICDIQWVWDKSRTWDKIHPLPDLSMKMADYIQECMR